MNPSDKRQAVVSFAQELGFDGCGCAPAGAIDRGDYYRRWLKAGCAGKMEYLHRHPDQRIDASVLLPGAKSVIVVSLSYHQPAPPKPRRREPGPRGKVAMYAWGDDYHKVIKSRLFRLVDRLRERIDEPFEAKVCVDTAPLLEREYAMRAGIGWIGKNTLVLNRRLGSYFFVGAVVTTLELACDEPALDHCGDCSRCLKACPTAALVGAYRMDASRCVSYLTIECRSAQIPERFHEGLGTWVFGCDVCQQVCPFNRGVPDTGEPRFAVRRPGSRPDLDEMIGWSDEKYGEVLAGSAMKRATPAMLRRNARIARKNAGAAANGP